MKIDIKIPTMKARIILLVGEYNDIEKSIPFGISGFGESGYIGRTLYNRLQNDLPHTAVIHSRTAAISVIAHEAIHAASYILEDMGCVASFANDEVQAYLVQHVCELAEKGLGTYD